MTASVAAASRFCADQRACGSATTSRAAACISAAARTDQAVRKSARDRARVHTELAGGYFELRQHGVALDEVKRR